MTVDPPDPADRPADPALGQTVVGQPGIDQPGIDQPGIDQPGVAQPDPAPGRLAGGQTGAGLIVIGGLVGIALGVSALIWVIAQHLPSAGDSAAAAATPQLLEIEQLLDRLGFPPGEIDGVFDRDTGKAIEAYQQAAGLTVDGQPNTALLDELREVAGGAAP